MEIKGIIKLEFKGIQLELTLEEVHELRNFLDTLIDDKNQYPVPVIYPLYPDCPSYPGSQGPWYQIPPTIS